MEKVAVDKELFKRILDLAGLGLDSREVPACLLETGEEDLAEACRQAGISADGDRPAPRVPGDGGDA